MNEHVSPSAGQRIASLRQYFQSRRGHARDPHFSAASGDPAMRSGAASEAWLPTEWPETQWSDTSFDPDLHSSP